VNRTREEILRIVENQVNGTEGRWDWDDFTSIPIADPELERVRAECVTTQDLAPWEREVILRRIAQELRCKLES
jgi:hypothetical protein